MYSMTPWRKFPFDVMTSDDKYSNWTHDEHAKAAFQPGRLFSFFKPLPGILIVGLGIYAFFIHDRYPLPPPVLMGVVILTFGLFIPLYYFHEKSKKTPVLCSRCHKPMKYVEANYPQDEAGGWHEYIRGESGRVYMGVSHGSHSGVVWYRLFRGIRECEPCKRYLVVAPQVMKRIGGSRSDVDEAERRSQGVDAMCRELQGKKIIVKKTVEDDNTRHSTQRVGFAKR